VTPRARYLLLKWRARVLLALGRRGAALPLFEQMLAMAPHDDYALASRAHLRAMAGDLSHAIADYELLLRSHPQSASAWFNLGFLQEQCELWQAAETSFLRATEINPALDRAWYGLGLVRIRLERYDDAIAALKRNIELQPMSPYGWYQLARVHVDRQEPDEAVKIIRHLQDFEPKVAAQLERETGLLAARSGR
jgi:tetratricopeptide (TPR) repeat protein